MKKCPICKMIVEAENECPYCQTTLTYEETIESEREHIVYNKYFFLCMIKRVWFSVACSVFCIIRVIIQHATISPLLLCMAGLCVVSLIVSIFQRGLEKTIQWKYSQNYSTYKVQLWKYLFGGVAILLSLVI